MVCVGRLRDVSRHWCDIRVPSERKGPLLGPLDRSSPRGVSAAVGWILDQTLRRNSGLAKSAGPESAPGTRKWTIIGPAMEH